MEIEFRDRIKSAMVIYQLEIELGNFVKNRHVDIENDSTGQLIIERNNKQEISELDNRHNVVENSYLMETLGLCESASKNTAEEKHIKDLRDLFVKLDVPNIRNAISHPNRPFPEYLWYRTAALATDPVIQKLNFSNVVQSFQNALDGKIQNPPDSWLSAAPIWEVPNNLPSLFEHSITGLVGRDKDLLTLDKLIKSGRAPLISVIAPGGVGKTSLVLEYLNDLCLTPVLNSNVNFDAVIYVSLKQDKLTSEGIQALDAPSSFEELKQTIVHELDDIFGGINVSFSDATNNYANKKLLLFIDNLETVLRDSPKYFEQLNDELPSTWVVLVTSRIAVDGSKNLPLDVLNKPGALHLARQYLFSKGETSRDQSLIERITEGCKYNPLAIRLCIDTYINGNDISYAITKTNESVTTFSFTNLLESLSETSQKLLEAIFVLETPTKVDLSESLGLDIDLVSSAIGELGRTSLILRQQTEVTEQYSLSRAIRDLLRSRPNNMHVRTQINAWLRQSKALTSELIKTQNKKGILPIDHNFVPINTPPILIQICKPLDSAIRRRDLNLIGSIEQKLRSQIQSYQTNVFLFRNIGRAQESLQDFQGAINSYRKAIELDSKDPAALFSLASILLKQEEYPESEQICIKLLELDDLNEITLGNKKSWVLSLLLRALLYQEKLDDVFDLTQNWKEDSTLSEVKGLSRVSAYRMLAHNHFLNKTVDLNNIETILIKALDALEELIRQHGYSQTIQRVYKKLISDIAFGISKERFTDNQERLSEKLGAFIKKHEYDLSGAFDTDYIQSLNVVKIFANLKIETPKAYVKSSDLSRPGSVNVESESSKHSLKTLKDSGYSIVYVSYIPNVKNEFPRYVFAKDDDGNDYILHVSAFENGNWASWVFLEVNIKLAVKYEDSRRGTGRRQATEILWPQ